LDKIRRKGNYYGIIQLQLTILINEIRTSYRISVIDIGVVC